MFWMKPVTVFSPCHSSPRGCAGVSMPEEPKQALLAHGESFDHDIAQYVVSDDGAFSNSSRLPSVSDQARFAVRSFWVPTRGLAMTGTSASRMAGT